MTTDLVDDPLLTDNNIRYFQKISKEMYKFTLVRRDYSSAIMHCRVACLSLSPYAGCGQALPTKILTYKEELPTDMKNMLYRRTADVKRLQKVIADTKQQFIDCL
jgi:hypothetical protein